MNLARSVIIAASLLFAGSASAQPTIDKVVPAVTTTLGGTLISVVGTGFSRDDQVFFDGKLSGTTYINSTQLRAAAPALERGTVEIRVVNRVTGLASSKAAAVRVLDLWLDLEPVLLPIYAVGNIYGANGSIFSTDFRLMNRAGEPRFVAGIANQIDAVEGVITGAWSGIAHLPPDRLVRPILTQRPRSANTPQTIPARVVFVERSMAHTLAASLHVAGRTNWGEPLPSAGTEVPIVEERELRSGRVDILSISVHADFRTMLRVYDPDNRRLGVVTVRVFGQDDLRPDQSTLLHEVSIQMETLSSFFAEVPSYPAYAQTSLDVSAVQNSGYKKVRVEVTSTNPAARLWALASVTNNLTQEISLYSPQ